MHPFEQAPPVIDSFSTKLAAFYDRTLGGALETGMFVNVLGSESLNTSNTLLYKNQLHRPGLPLLHFYAPLRSDGETLGAEAVRWIFVTEHDSPRLFSVLAFWHCRAEASALERLRESAFMHENEWVPDHPNVSRSPADHTPFFPPGVSPSIEGTRLDIHVLQPIRDEQLLFLVAEVRDARLRRRLGERAASRHAYNKLLRGPSPDQATN